MRSLKILTALLLGSSAFGDVTQCACNLASPESMSSKECSLCREAESHPTETAIFFLKDINPRKPNRWLALPRSHGKAQHALAEMPRAERVALWTAAIEKAKLLWGNEWGLAINGDQSRTQCHAHIHIGKLLEGTETGQFVVVKGPAEIPAPPDGGGLWVHPDGDKLHVHLGEQITEFVLLR